MRGSGDGLLTQMGRCMMYLHDDDDDDDDATFNPSPKDNLHYLKKCMRYVWGNDGTM